MYTNPRRITRNAKLGQIEAMHFLVSQCQKAIGKGDEYGAGMYAAKAWHAMNLAGTEAVKAAKRKNY